MFAILLIIFDGQIFCRDVIKFSFEDYYNSSFNKIYKISCM